LFTDNLNEVKDSKHAMHINVHKYKKISKHALLKTYSSAKTKPAIKWYCWYSTDNQRKNRASYYYSKKHILDTEV